jgi:chitin disaccharide deacetylase
MQPRLEPKGPASQTESGMRFLIVNADDFGRSEAVNLGVAEGFRRGIITSTSVVAAGPAFESALRMAPSLKGLGIGVHLAVDEYQPILPAADIPTLVGPEGQFRSRRRQFLNMASNPRMRGDLLREWDAQISRIVAAGVKLTHIDGHGHCHVHPAVTGIIIQLAERYGIVHVRLPAEPLSMSRGQILSRRFGEKAALQFATQLTRRKWKDRLLSPRSFYGFSPGGHMTSAVLRRVTDSIPPGISELMVHVGLSNDEAAGFWTGYDWVGDLNAVTSHTKEQFEDKFDVRLVTHTQGRPDGVG